MPLFYGKASFLAKKVSCGQPIFYPFDSTNYLEIIPLSFVIMKAGNLIVIYESFIA
jgi:hypothetical protein